MIFLRTFAGMTCKDKKNKQLGHNVSTASARLKKSILFHYIKKAGDNWCFQCGAEIESEVELSIEHKIPWLDSDEPNELFYDLNNIAFSHLSCNIKAARKAQPNSKQRIHPSPSAYNRGCRCDECRAINITRLRFYKEKKKD